MTVVQSSKTHDSDSWQYCLYIYTNLSLTLLGVIFKVLYDYIRIITVSIHHFYQRFNFFHISSGVVTCIHLENVIWIRSPILTLMIFAYLLWKCFNNKIGYIVQTSIWHTQKKPLSMSIFFLKRQKYLKIVRVPNWSVIQNQSKPQIIIRKLCITVPFMNDLVGKMNSWCVTSIIKSLFALWSLFTIHLSDYSVDCSALYR